LVFRRGTDIGTLNGLCFGELYNICGHHFAGYDVIREHRNELCLVFWLEQIFHGAFGKLRKSLVRQGKYSEWAFSLQSIDKFRGLQRRRERLKIARSNRRIDDVFRLSSGGGAITRRGIARHDQHGGYGDKQAALHTLAKNLARLSKKVRRLVTLENDDKTYTPTDLLPFCQEQGIPFVYDIHHHRCTPDGMSEEEATRQALTTWDREPLFHISSPREGWNGPKPHRHHDYINIRDFPGCWQGIDVTVKVEAKAKELAVKKLVKALVRRAARFRKIKKNKPAWVK
jgi:hypothetical protein